MVNIYDVCYNILTLTLDYILTNYEEGETSDELIKFLTTDENEYDELFYEIKKINSYFDVKKCKQIMMLIIASSSYYLSLYSIKNNIDIEIYEEILDDLNSSSYKDIIYKFIHWKDHEEVFDYIDDFVSFYEKNYIYFNNCMQEVIKQGKLLNICKINPFEALNYMQYEPNKILKSEKMLQDFIDMYNASYYEVQIDESKEAYLYENDDEYFVNILYKKISKKYKSEEKKLFSYIFSNIYEFIYSQQLPIQFRKKYKFLLDEFYQEDIDFSNIYNLYLNDYHFAMNLNDCFVEINESIVIDDLGLRRENFKKFGNIEVLRKLNPFYEEEEVGFTKRKAFK